MSESPEPPPAPRPYARATRRGLGLAALIATIGGVVFAVGAVGARPTGTLPGGESWSPTRGASVGSTGNPRDAASRIVDFVISPDRQTLYALQAPGIVAYDAESLARTGEIALESYDARIPASMVMSADGTGIFVLGWDGRLTLASVRPEAFGGMVASTLLDQVYGDPNGRLTASYPGPVIYPRWRPMLQSAPDGSAAYLVDFEARELVRYSVGDGVFGEPLRIPIELGGAWGGDATTLSVNPVSGEVYLVEDGGVLHVFAPPALEDIVKRVRAPAAWRANAFAEDGSLFYEDATIPEIRDGTVYYADGALYAFSYGVLSYERGVLENDRWTPTGGRSSYMSGVGTFENGILRLGTLDAALRPVGPDLPLGAVADPPILVTTPTPALVLTNGSHGGMALVEVSAGVVVAELQTMLRSAQWAVGVDFHHLYFLDRATDPFNLHRFDVSASAPELGRYRSAASAILLLALVIGGGSVTQRRWRPVVARRFRWAAALLAHHRAPEGEPTPWGERARVFGVVGGVLMLFPSLFSFGTSAAQGFVRVGLAVALAVVAGIGLRWVTLAMTISSGAAWLAAEQFHPAAVGFMTAGLALGFAAAALTPAPRPAYEKYDPGRIRTLTLFAIGVAWIPILNLMLATPAYLDADKQDKVNARAAFWAMAVSWVITLVVVCAVLWFLGAINQEDPGWSNPRP